MSEQNRLSGVIGTAAQRSWIHRGAFTHRPSDSGSTSDYQRLLQTYERMPRPPEVVAIMRFSGLALLATPVALFIAFFVLHTVIADEFVNDNRVWLIGWGVVAMAVLFAPLGLQVGRAIWLQKVFIALVTVATAAVSVGYVKIGLDAYATASTSPPERTYELIASCGRRCSYVVHQREDGSTVEGVNRGPAVPYAPTCTRVQRVNGERGFSWIRVIERSQPSTSGLWFPIRREDCFGKQPVSSLKG